jgi:cell division septal protein FtsQ
MRIFSKHRKQFESGRRFSSPEFRDKIRQAQNYRRTIDYKIHRGPISRFFDLIGLGSFFAKFVILAVIVAVGYFLFISDYFLITSIAVAGNQQIASEQVSKSLLNESNSKLFFIPKNHFILMTRDRANEMLTEKYPLIKEIEQYDRHLPNTLSVKIKERYPGFVLQSNNKQFLVDEEGYIVEENPVSSSLLVLTDQANDDFAVGEMLSPKLTTFIISIQKSWPSKITSKIASVKIPIKASTEVVFTTNEGWSVFFDINRSVQVQINSLALLVNKQVASQRSKLAYIDLRLSKWAYICYKNTPCFQQPQLESSVSGVEVENKE